MVSMCCVSTSCLRCSAMWVSKDAYTPKVRWGTESGQYTHAAKVRKPPSLLCLGRGVVLGGPCCFFCSLFFLSFGYTGIPSIVGVVIVPENVLHFGSFYRMEVEKNTIVYSGNNM